MAQLSGDVSMVNANTFYDGPSLTLAAGTWFVTATLTITLAASPGQFTVKLWDGTTAFAATSDQGAVGTGTQEITLSGKVVLAGSTTIKVSIASTAASNTISATPPANATGLTNMASTITAVKQ